MTGPSAPWSPSPQAFPQPAPQGFHPPAPPFPTSGGPVAWAGGVAPPPLPGPPRAPVDVGAVLRLVAGALLVAAGLLVAIACTLTVFEIENDFGDPPFEATAWSDSGERYPTPVRWGIPMAAVAVVLLVGGVLVVVSRWSARVRGAAAAMAAAAAGGALAVGWMVGDYVADLDATLRENGSAVEGFPEVLRTGGGTVLLQIALWTALAAVVPLVLAPVLDAARARAALGGVR
ncbi:hypothetical protein [Blastococcus sp. TF02A-26]|uniref:hypothetical protein n=1 Tax=Blastococcus sp. TF02A-26 TaxID=2250577 RepID=UPI000DE826B0|nr:hypothetical protein [Blastococcus sp. TF02A-26]RBY89912.1 hypothetical protein DQ240_03160 [Blastococcus sp. TF02A-26]